MGATVTSIGTTPDFVPEAGVDAIDLHAFRRFMVAQGAEFSFGERWPMEQDLRNARVVEEVSGVLRPTLYGLMVFGKDPQSYATATDLYTVCVAYDGSDRSSDRLRAAEIRGRLDKQVVGSLDWFRDLVLSASPVAGTRGSETDEGRAARSFRIRNSEDLPLVPAGVLREALVNAVIHRDYAITDSQVMLEVFRDRVEVTSPGGLPNRMTVERARGGGAPRSRNEAKANAMVVAGLTGRRGCGWLLMRRTMREFNGTEPELVSEEGQFTRVTFRLGGT